MGIVRRWSWGRLLSCVLLLGAVLLHTGCREDGGAAAVVEETVAVTPPKPVLRWMGPAFVRPVDREIVAVCAEEAATSRWNG